MPVFNRPTDRPIDQVKALKARGFDNNQIVQALQRGGYSSTQIFDALNQADLANPGQMVQNPGMFANQNTGTPPAINQYQPQQQTASMSQDSGEELTDKQIEEMIEAIVEEKWQTVGKDYAKILDWKNDTDTKLAKMEQRIDELKDTFDKLHQAIIGKIGEYDKNILSVGAEIKAMEKVFSKVLPVFTENVNELSRITQNLSSKK